MSRPWFGVTKVGRDQCLFVGANSHYSYDPGGVAAAYGTQHARLNAGSGAPSPRYASILALPASESATYLAKGSSSHARPAWAAGSGVLGTGSPMETREAGEGHAGAA